jgi:capsular polysaccharide export protein
LALVGAVMARPGQRLRVIGRGPWAHVDRHGGLIRAVREQVTGRWHGIDPFTGKRWGWSGLSSIWPDGAGWWKAIARWRRCWAWRGGSGPRWRRCCGTAGGGRVSAEPGGWARACGRWHGARGWRRGQGEALETAGVTLGEVEDGFVRSAGLGADCVPPLGGGGPCAAFRPVAPKRSGTLLGQAPMDEALLARAGALRVRLVAGGLANMAGAQG